MLEGARVRTARGAATLRDLPAMTGAWVLDQLVGPYPEPKQPPPSETKTGEVVPFPTERDLDKPERRDPPS